MVQSHLQVSKGDKDDIRYMVKALYIQDKNASSDETEFSGKDTEIKMDFSWTRPYTFFSRPPYDANATLEINILVGSEATQMWMEIEMLKDIGLLIDEAPEEKEAKLMESMCTRNFTALNSTLRSQVQYFITNGALPGQREHIPSAGMQNGILLLNQIYEEITKGRKTDIDLTEILWSVLKNCTDPVEVCSCFKLLFRESAAGRFNSGFLPDNNTTVAQVIQGFIQRTNIRNVLPRLRKSDGLMLLFELGCLKIQRDYRQIFQRIDISGHIFNQVSEKLKLLPATSSANRQKCLENLVDVHSLLEVLLLLRSHLHLEEDSLHNIATSALTILLSSDVDLPKSQNNNIMFDEESLHRNLSLSLPMHPKLLIPLVKGLIPNTWSVCLASSVKKYQVKTVFHAENEIFPSGLQDGDQTISDNADNQIVHFTLVSDEQFCVN
ncbi:hypothetical protein J437_LFUL004579 [Ladona fulva]|uniref:Protein zwilch n=1 Tax=Ladona fulva TaxID=123851 RepID=A0A8K0NUM5_LADFU|nr:hypothetical protein J437_LFUL004579 [Ladona fulva]